MIKMYTTFLLCSMCFLAGCGKNVEVKPLESMPTMYEITEYSKEHSEEEINAVLKDIKTVLDQTSFEESVERIEASVREWEKEQKTFPLERVELTFEQDKLQMKYLENQKAYNNISAMASVYYERNSDKTKEEAVQMKLRDQVKEILLSTPYGKYQIGTLVIELIDVNHSPLEPHARLEERYDLKEDVFTVEQNAEFSQIQTFGYDTVWKFSKRIYGEERTETGKGLYLKRFGIEEEKETLTFTVGVTALPDAVEREQFYEIMNKFKDEVYFYIRDDEAMISYLDEKNVRYLEFIFETPWTLERENKVMKNNAMYDLHFGEDAPPAHILSGKNPYWNAQVQVTSQGFRGNMLRRQEFDMPSEIKISIIYDDEVMGECFHYTKGYGSIHFETDVLPEFSEFEEMRLDENEFQSMALELEYEDQSMRIDLEKE